jgi:hypothetical protein
VQGLYAARFGDILFVETAHRPDETRLTRCQAYSGRQPEEQTMPSHDEELESAFFAALHCVRISVPELGFGSDMVAMIEFYWERGEELYTGYLRTRTYPRDWIYFCFTDAKNAEDFAGRFGGESLSPAEVSRQLGPVRCCQSRGNGDLS